MQPQDGLPMGVVIERRAIDSPWADHAWKPVAVIPGAPEVSDWKEIASGEGWVHYHAATLPLRIYAGETEGYRVNLSNSPPLVFVVLRRGEEAEDHDVEPALVTVCPYEASGYEESGDEIVEGIPMAEDLRAWLADFVNRHHVEQPFKKRKRKPFDPRKDSDTRPRPRVPVDGFDG
ncbi:MAG: DUF3305 domain-containing protein [Rhodospirillales bacterium]